MKTILRTLIVLCFFPFMLLGGIIAIVKTLIICTFGFAYKRGDDWHINLMEKINNLLRWLKN